MVVLPCVVLLADLLVELLDELFSLRCILLEYHLGYVMSGFRFLLVASARIG